MKVTITPDNWVEIEAENAADVLEIVRALRNGQGLDKVYTGPLEDTTEALGRFVDAAKFGKLANWSANVKVKLAPAQAEVYEFLTDNDQDEGWGPATLADAFGIKTAAMDQRLRGLIKKGLVKRLSRGLYRVAK